MNEYRIEKCRLPIAVTLIGGERLEGDVFVQATARFRPGPEDARDLFNSAEPFFPMADAAGTQLIAKDGVIEVEAEIAADDDPIESSLRALVEIEMVNGTVRAGSVCLEVPMERPRLLDFLNFHTLRFLTLHTSDGTRLLNRRLIARVRPLD